jgi:hypothetical protein
VLTHDGEIRCRILMIGTMAIYRNGKPSSRTRPL